MSIETILERIAVAVEAIAGNASAPAEKPASKPRAAKPAAPAASPAPAESPAATAVVPAAAAPAVTREDVANAVTTLINAGNREAVKAALAAHGASNISTIKPEHYASVLKHLQAPAAA